MLANKAAKVQQPLMGYGAFADYMLRLGDMHKPKRRSNPGYRQIIYIKLTRAHEPTLPICAT